VSRPRIDFWYRTCLAVDSTSGQVTVALNGQVLEVGRQVGDLVENRPSTLEERIVIGKWNRTSKGVDEQYPWSISNLQLFHWRPESDLAALSGLGCSQPGDYLAWSGMEWSASGEHVQQYDLPLGEVCSQERQERYDLAVALEQTQAQTLATCRKLGHAWMTTKHSHSRKEFEDYIAWFDETTGKRCKRLWTPFSDEEVTKKHLLNEGWMFRRRESL
jgi:hypothetical protein